MDKITIGDIMSEKPIKVKKTYDVGSVAHLLLRYKISGIFVTEGDSDTKLFGVVTTTDLLRLMGETLSSGGHRLEELKKISKMEIGLITTREVVYLQKDDSVLKAIALMHQKNIHTIPVLDNEKLVGVVGRHDILNMAFA